MSAGTRRSSGSMQRRLATSLRESDNLEYIRTPSDTESDPDFDGSLSEFTDDEEQDKATPLISRSNRTASYHRQHSSPRTLEQTEQVRTPSSSSRSAPRSTPASAEPSLIMPSMSGPTSQSANGSPMRNSQMRQRRRTSQTSRRASSSFPVGMTVQETPDPWHYVRLFYEYVGLPLVTYFWDVFSYANRHFFKPLLGLAFGVGIILLALQVASGLIYARVSTALAPICLVPGSSYFFSMCARPQHEAKADFEELINVQSHFEEILDASKDTSTLPATIKDSEIAIRDLRTLVKHSRLPSRNQLDLEFHNFVLTAKEAADDLMRYNSRIGSAIDRVIATNTWTMAVLQGIEENEASKGSIARIVSAMTGNFVAPPPTLQQRIFDQYILHVGKNKDEITSLIKTAQALLMVLTNLDKRLDTIYSITVNDDITISRSQEELLSSLWTKLGGNSMSVKSNAKQLNLLKNISQYRKKALRHVSETLLKLQQIQAELENLREGVAAPEILGWREGLPITYHIDLVEKGVERLRVARGESMRVEGEMLRNRIKGSEMGGDNVKELPPGGRTNIVTVTAKGG